MKAAFVTLGCKVNQYESNALAALLKSSGFTVVPPEEDADVYIVNSCTVTAESSRKSRQALRHVRREHPNAVTVFTGCYSQAYREEPAALEEADIVLGNKTNDRLVAAIRAFIETKQRQLSVEEHLRGDAYTGFGAATFEGHTRAYIKIQDGCNRFCTYCIIPKSRGFSRSRPLEEIEAELRCIAENGYKEAVFVGINLSSYGLETGMNICDALAIAQRTSGIERFRLGSLEPDHITDEVIEALTKMDKFCPQFHISLQSGCDRILKRMNRHYTAAEYETLCGKLREAFPGLSLTTDIIAGFPGETEEDFLETVAFAEKIGFMKVHVFPYSRREGTPAANAPDQVDKHTKLDRCARLQTACDALRNSFLRQMVGSTQEVLFETPKHGMQQGYTRNYTPVAVACPDCLTGQIRNVKITGTDGDGCVGEIV